MATVCHSDRVLLEDFPVSLVDRASDTLMLAVHEDVPDSVQLISTVVVLGSDRISSFVAIGVRFTVLGLVMEGLVHVTDVVDQKSQGK